MKTPAAPEVVRGNNINFTNDIVIPYGWHRRRLRRRHPELDAVRQHRTVTVTRTAANGVNIGEVDDHHQSSTALVTLNDTVTQNRITMRAARSWSMP